ncbi:DUF6215 domain-containing protein [Streptomyces sp. NPDC048629]|uniref:DUF6215 domain-containing protein n=1 Tax=Streptomyces sp. NPDC048629 TaxID=3154824 RepID=UPI003426A41B
MADGSDALPKGAAGVWGQVVAALILVPALCVGLWALGETGTPTSVPTPAAACPEEKPARTDPPRVSEAQLCDLLKRPDLAQLLGTPSETPKSAGGRDGSIGRPSGRVDFETYTVTLSAGYDGLPVTESVAFLGKDAQERTVLGHPAVLSSDYTLSISFRLDGSDATSGPGVPVRTLTVARDPKDGGDSFELSLWRANGGVPDDAVLLRVAEKVLPTIPGWEAA